MTTEYSERDIALMPSWMELRQSQEISLEQVEQLTRISIKKLEAIEAHEFELLGDATFAMGYIRAYAKALSRDPEVFLQVYRDALSPMSENDESKVGAGSVFEPAVRTFKQMSLLQLSVAVIVLWGAVMILFSGDSEGMVVAPVALEHDSAEDSIEEPSAGEQDSLIEDTVNEEAVNEGVLVDVELDADGGVTYETEIEEPSNDVPALTSVAADEGASGGDDSVGDTHVLEAAANPATDEDILLFSFTDECWVEVTDASGTTLIAQLQRKGDNQRVFGQAPFKVMLGNARAATLTLNGEVVSIEPRPGKNTLRFTASR